MTFAKFQSATATSGVDKGIERNSAFASFDVKNPGADMGSYYGAIGVLQNIHVDSDSPANISYHNIWRNIANQRMQLSPSGKNVHFTTLYSMSAADAQKLKAMVLEFIHSTREVVLPSPEETVMCFGCDLFEL